MPEEELGKAYYISFPGYRAKEDSSGMEIPTGHAGVLLVSPDGLTKYYEYGRYGKQDKRRYGEQGNRPGLVRKVSVPNYNGTNLEAILSVIKKSNTQNVGNKLTVSEVPNVDFNAAQKAVDNFAQDADRKPYRLIWRNCGSFADDVIRAGYTGNVPVTLFRTPVHYSTNYEKAGFDTRTYKHGGFLKRR